MRLAPATGVIAHAPGFSRSLLRRRPTTPFELLAVAAWAGLVVSSLAVARGQGSGMMAMGMGSMASMRAGVGATSTSTSVSTALAQMPMWTVMVGAMMLPGAMPAATHVAIHSYRWRRGRAVTEYVALHCAAWVLFGAVARTATRFAGLNGPGVLAAALALAALWQLTPAKRRAVRDCHRTVPLPPAGWPAALGIARFAAINSGACIRSCGPMMLAMAIAPGSQMLIWMPLVAAVMSLEKLGARPGLSRRAGAVALAIAAVACWLV